MGFKPLLVRAETAAKARDSLVELVALTGEQMADALAEGRKIHSPGDPIEVEKPATNDSTTTKKED